MYPADSAYAYRRALSCLQYSERLYRGSFKRKGIKLFYDYRPWSDTWKMRRITGILLTCASGRVWLTLGVGILRGIGGEYQEH